MAKGRIKKDVGTACMPRQDRRPSRQQDGFGLHVGEKIAEWRERNLRLGCKNRCAFGRLAKHAAKNAGTLQVGECRLPVSAR
jgi:hypothetical protein